MNHVIISGRLTKDAEIRYTNNKKAVASFTLAVDDGRDPNGGRKAVFIPCIAWEKTAELIDQYTRKGDGLTVIGKVSVRSYEKDGQKRFVTEIVATGIEFPFVKKEGKVKESSPDAFEDIEEDGELPF